MLPERKNDKFQLLVKVTGLERVGSFANKKENPTIKLDVSTNLPTFRKHQHRELKKTFSEFQNLYKFLNGSILETFVPALPPSSTNYGIANSEDYYKTVKNIQEWFDRIAADPFILRSQELAFFLESDFNTYTPVAKAKLPISGLKRKTLKQLAPPFDECLELAEFRPLVKSIHHLTQEIQAKLLKLCKLRKSLSHDETAVGQSFKDMALQDPQQAHGKFYTKFGKTLTALGDIDSVIATLDIATLHDGLEWVVQETYTVKEALTNRHFLMRDLLQAQQNTTSKQEQARKLRARRDVSPLKVDEAIRALKAATTAEQELTLKLRRVTANMLLQKKTWLEWCNSTLVASIKDYTLPVSYTHLDVYKRQRIRRQNSKLVCENASVTDPEPAKGAKHGHGVRVADRIAQQARKQLDTAAKEKTGADDDLGIAHAANLRIEKRQNQTAVGKTREPQRHGIGEVLRRTWMDPRVQLTGKRIHQLGAPVGVVSEMHQITIDGNGMHETLAGRRAGPATTEPVQTA